MNILESLRLAFRALTANKLRAALTMLGIIIGVGAVITLMSAGEGVQVYIEEQFQGMGSNLLFVIPGSEEESMTGPPGMTAGTAELTNGDVEALRDQVESVDVDVREDKVHGTIARVAARPAAGTDPAGLRERIDAILGQYTVRYELLLSGGA